MNAWQRLEALGPVWTMGALVLAILVLATIVTAVLGRVRPKWKLDESRRLDLSATSGSPRPTSGTPSHPFRPGEPRLLEH